jgi:hypothetical protein
MYELVDFLEAEEYSKLGFIVNTPTCKILNVSVWDKAILPFVGDSSGSSSSAKDLRCNLNRQWTYVDEEQVRLPYKTHLKILINLAFHDVTIFIYI